jgi:hypothetical protein
MKQGGGVELVPGRACGECSVCCVVLNIDTPEFQKLPRVPCQYLRTEGGCAIHATCFPACRTYHCGWRYLKGLGKDWRPDRSGILIDFQTDGLPENYPKRPGIRLMPTEALEALFAPGVQALLSSLVLAEVPAILAVPGPPGHFPVSIFLSDALREPVLARDPAKIAETLRGLLAGLAGHTFAPVRHHHGAEAEQG